MSQAHGRHHADVDPANIKLVPAVGKLGRSAERVMVVVQLFATDDDADGADVGGGVVRRVIAITPEVAGTVDDAGRRDRDPGQLDRPHGKPGKAEQREENDQRHAHALPRVLAVDIALHPVVRRAVAVAGDGVGVLRFLAVEVNAKTQHAPVAVNHRAVRVLGRFTFGVVLAMDRDPFARHHAGRQPQPHAEEVRDDGVQVQRTMRLRPVQKDGHSRDGDVGGTQQHQHIAPPGQINGALNGGQNKIDQGSLSLRSVGYRSRWKRQSQTQRNSRHV